MSDTLNTFLNDDLEQLKTSTEDDLYVLLAKRMGLRTQILTDATMSYASRFNVKDLKMESVSILKRIPEVPGSADISNKNLGFDAFGNFKKSFHNMLCGNLIDDASIADFIKTVNSGDALKLGALITAFLLPTVPSALATVVATLLSKIFINNIFLFAHVTSDKICGVLKKSLGI
jgi:hypothetical protein